MFNKYLCSTWTPRKATLTTSRLSRRRYFLPALCHHPQKSGDAMHLIGDACAVVQPSPPISETQLRKMRDLATDRIPRINPPLTIHPSTTAYTHVQHQQHQQHQREGVSPSGEIKRKEKKRKIPLIHSPLPLAPPSTTHTSKHSNQAASSGAGMSTQSVSHDKKVPPPCHRLRRVCMASCCHIQYLVKSCGQCCQG